MLHEKHVQMLKYKVLELHFVWQDADTITWMQELFFFLVAHTHIFCITTIHINFTPLSLPIYFNSHKLIAHKMWHHYTWNCLHYILFNSSILIFFVIFGTVIWQVCDHSFMNHFYVSKSLLGHNYQANVFTFKFITNQLVNSEFKLVYG